MPHLGLDIGYGQTKLAWSNSYGSPVAEVHPSGAAPFEQCDRAERAHGIRLSSLH